MVCILKYLEHLGIAPVGKIMSMPVRTVVSITYAVFFGLYFPIHWRLAGTAVSGLFTIAALFQCLGFAMLVLQTMAHASTKGISANSLELKLLALICRLSNSTWLDGYLPMDATGDWLFQALDFISLGLLLWLLHRAYWVERFFIWNTQCQTVPLALACLSLATLLHGNGQELPIFDSLWMASVLLTVVAEIPQRLLIAKRGIHARTLAAHYFACMAVSSVCNGSVLWIGYDDHKVIDDGFNYVSFTMVSAQGVHIILLADFIFCHIRAVRKGNDICRTRAIETPLPI